MKKNPEQPESKRSRQQRREQERQAARVVQTPAAATQGRDITPSWLKFPAIPLILTGLFLGFLLLPRVQANPRLIWTYVGVAGVLVVWTLMLWEGAKRRVGGFRMESTKPLKSHYIQGSVQILVYCYWSTAAPEVRVEAPLILSQFLFLYIFDALLSWSRGRPWRLGFGPLPIILSTNIFIWFKEDWYLFQFLLVATGALGKEFIKWYRDGRYTHIFNPSAFTLGLFSVILILSGTTDYTWAGRIADTFGKPEHIYLVVFSLGLIVQYFFSVTLMTLATAATLGFLSLAYFWSTGTYYFVFTNIPAPVFLGMHLLVTDPSTSPRTNAGKIIFGMLYAILTFTFYGILAHFNQLTVYDKLLPIPILNASVQIMDRVAHSGFITSLGSTFAKFLPRQLNLLHIACWAALFFTMLSTGFIGGAQKGNTLDFWKQAIAEGRPNAEKGYVEVLKSMTRSESTFAWNELGQLYMQGKYVEKDPKNAARCFAKASKLGSVAGSANLVKQFLAVEGAQTATAITSAFNHLEQECKKDDDGAGGAIFYLVGSAYEMGKGRPLDKARARLYFKAGCTLRDKQCCEGLLRL